MIERSFHFAGIPLLTIASGEEPRPVVFFYHGLHSSKETHRKELEDIARSGFLAVGVDAIAHGERGIDDLSAFLNRADLRMQVTKLLRPAAAEVPFLIDHFEASGYGPFGLAGISFGGMLAFGAAAGEPRLRAVVAILGDPDWCDPTPSAFETTALLAWNGGRDQHVDPQGAREFLSTLRRIHPDGEFEYREYPESDHFMEPDDWNDGWKATLAWFEKHLRAA